MKSRVLLIFLGIVALAFGGVPKDRFDPCLLTVVGCNTPSTTKAPNTKASENLQIKAKLVSNQKSKNSILFYIFVHS